MSLKTDIDNIKNLEQGITNNKVSKFAYTDTAYTNNDVNGVQTYNINNEQNIPVADADVLQVNTTITNKGYRAQASSLTRMLVNHFFGRVSYNLNKINDFFLSFLTSFSSYLGQPNGVATLDVDGRIPYSQLPETAVEYKGEWNAETNTPTLADGIGTKGDMYYVSVNGTQNLGSGDIVFLAGDRIIYNGSVWQKLSGGSVKKVNNIRPDDSGNVQLSFSDLDGTVTYAINAGNAYRGMVHTCSTSNNVTEKTIAITDFILATGACIRVLFTNGNNITSPTLNVNNTGAKEIVLQGGKKLTTQYGSSSAGAYGWSTNIILELMYDGEFWVILGNPVVYSSEDDPALRKTFYMNGWKEYSGSFYSNTQVSADSTKQILRSRIETNFLFSSRYTITEAFVSGYNQYLSFGIAVVDSELILNCKSNYEASQTVGEMSWSVKTYGD